MTPWKMNRNQIKYLVILAMVIDHVAWRFVPSLTLEGQIMHLIGRLTGPAMAFFIAEGYMHTRNLKSYLVRMGIFALLSWGPFVLYFNVPSPLGTNLGIIFTLFLGLLAISIDQNTEIAPEMKPFLILACALFSVWGDWPGYGVLAPLLVAHYYQEKTCMWRKFAGFTILYTLILGATEIGMGSPLWGESYLIGVLLPLLLLRYGYNGESGSRAPFHRWFFYIFYPVHLLILYGISQWMGV